MKDFNGRVLFLDRSDINTDEIIPARYLTEISKEALKPYLLEDLDLDSCGASGLTGAGVIITRANFGCGSSREHAPWALEVNGINLVIAESFARIFKQNMFNCGMMAVELPLEKIDRLFDLFSKEDAWLATDLESRVLTLTGGGKKERVPFSISGFDKSLIEAGGWVNYADLHY